MAITVQVRNNNLEQAMRVLKKKIQKDGLLRIYRMKQVFQM